MADGQPQKGVTDCYIFKSRLQEYAQKVGIPTPVYQTVKEGPSHEPVFKSTVIVNNVRYDSLPGFFNRKSAEQSAAEVALLELEKSGKTTVCMPTIHETGLCKNLLQEYAQKMNFAIPSYQCSKHPSGELSFSCSVEVGGIHYIGAAAKTKKEAEIKAARTALLAIQSSSSGNEPNGVSQYTVLPGKKKAKEAEAQTEAPQDIKTKKVEFKKKWSKRKYPRNRGNRLKSNKMDGGTADSDASFIQFVNGGTLEGNKGPYSSDQKIDNMVGTTAHKVEHPAMLSFDAGMSFHHVDVPFVRDASTIPQVSQLGNSAILTRVTPSGYNSQLNL